MKTLVVGTGSVGRVFAYHLHRAGCAVTFLSRNGHAGDLEGGVVLYQLNRRRPWNSPVRFTGFDVVTLDSRPVERRWDQIYMCVPSNALCGGLPGWIREFGGDATVVKLQPGLNDCAVFTSNFPVERMVVGIPTLASYSVPLHGEKVSEPGTAYWFPPLMPSRFSGPGERVREVVETLNAGGLPARRHADVERLLSYISAVEVPLTAGHECAGWSIRAFCRGRWFSVACRAIREAAAVVSMARHTATPPLIAFANPTMLRLAIFLLQRERKVPLEPYLKHHFTKLRLQSRQHIDDYLRVAAEYGIPVPGLWELKNGLGPD
jgi:ketopantoate reductase